MKIPIKRKKPAYRYRTVMLIDDNELDNFINQKVIEGNFFAETIYVNTNGSSALEFLKNLALNKNVNEDLLPDVIFVDINMPLMDGFQFVEEFLKLSYAKQNQTKLVILTSSTNEKDIESASRLSKKVSFIAKPLTESALKEL